MGKIFYNFNPDTLTYEELQLSFSQKIWIFLRHIFIGIGIGVILFIVAMYAFDSPIESQLKKENKLLLTQYEILSRRIAENQMILEDLQQRDNQLYRTIFNAEPIPESIRRPGFGGTNRYEHLSDMPNSELIISTTQKLDMMTKELYVQSNSYDELIELVKMKEERMKNIPAVMPLSNKDKKQITSGYGWRIHPLRGVRHFHSGIDLNAEAGSPIYATGNGIVESAEWKGGYGYCITINHGFGYKSLYAHCKEMIAKPGQKVVRGQKIATVGMTGVASGNHVHYEVIVRGQYDNPAKYFFMDLTPEEYNEVLFISENR